MTIEDGNLDEERRSIRALRAQLRSTKTRERLAAIDYMQGRGLKGYFTLARSALHDRDSNVRWQAAILMGEFIPLYPAAIWRVVLHYGKSRSQDVRDMIACVLLEHVVQQHPDVYYPLWEKLKVDPHKQLRETANIAWDFTKPRWKENNSLPASEHKQAAL